MGIMALKTGRGSFRSMAFDLFQLRTRVAFLAECLCGTQQEVRLGRLVRRMALVTLPLRHQWMNNLSGVEKLAVAVVTKLTSAGAQLFGLVVEMAGRALPLHKGLMQCYGRLRRLNRRLFHRVGNRDTGSGHRCGRCRCIHAGKKNRQQRVPGL